MTTEPSFAVRFDEVTIPSVATRLDEPVGSRPAPQSVLDAAAASRSKAFRLEFCLDQLLARLLGHDDGSEPVLTPLPLTDIVVDTSQCLDRCNDLLISICERLGV